MRNQLADLDRRLAALEAKVDGKKSATTAGASGSAAARSDKPARRPARKKKSEG